MVKNCTPASTFCRQRGPWSQNEAQDFCRGKRFNQCTLKLKNKPAWCACVYTPQALRLLQWMCKTTISLSPWSTEVGAALGPLPHSDSPDLAPQQSLPGARHTLPVPLLAAGVCPRGCSAGHANGAGSSVHCCACATAMPGSHQGTGCSTGLAVPAGSSGTVAGMAGLTCIRHLNKAPGSAPSALPRAQVLFCASVLNMHTKFVLHPAAQPSCSQPGNWGKEASTHRHRFTQNNATIRPGRTKGAQAPGSRTWPDSYSRTVPAPDGVCHIGTARKNWA